MKRLPPQQPNYTIRRERDSRSSRRLLLLLVCGVVLAGGFLFAASLYFKAVRYGYQNEQLRRERDRLLEEQRRLLLEREAAVSPVNLSRAARKIGMKPATPDQINPKPKDASNRSQQNLTFIGTSITTHD
jgi:cell division protein FtsL